MRGGPPMPKRMTDDCPVCHPEGHSARRHGARLRRAAIFSTVEVGPVAVAAGDRFVVIESACGFIGDNVFEAVAPTGKTDHGYDEWKLRPPRTNRLTTGYPQLHPFFKMSPARRAKVSIEHHAASPVGKKTVAL